jgi:hypothetical protein
MKNMAALCPESHFRREKNGIEMNRDTFHLSLQYSGLLNTVMH